MKTILRQLQHWAVLSALFTLPFVTGARAAAPVILVQPVGKSAGTNSTIRFNATVNGSSPFSYRWELSGGVLTNGSGVSGVTLSNLTIGPVQPYHAGDYRVVITNFDGAVTSAWATLTVTKPPGPGACTIGLSHYSATHSAEPVTAQVDVIAAAGCTWGLVNTNAWITHVVGVGDSNGFVRYTLGANTLPTARIGILVIGGNTFTITQLGIINTSSCAIALAPTSRGHGSGFSTGTVTVTTAPGCFWQVISTNEWITAPAYTNVGPSGFVYSVSPNPNATSRTGHLLVGDQWFMVIQSGVTSSPPCSFLLSAVSAQHNSGSSTGSVSVTTGAGCFWNAFTTNNWITLLSSPSNSGSGTVIYLVAPNPNNASRSGNIRIDGQNFLVLQDGISTNPPPCTIAISPTSASHSANSETGFVSVAAAPGCAWSVVNTNGWITHLVVTNVGAIGVRYVVAPNNSLSQRTGVLRIGNQSFTVVQLGGIASCSYAISPSSRAHDYEGATGIVEVATQPGCGWNVFNSNAWVTLLSSVSNSGSGQVLYSVLANTTSFARSGNIRIDGRIFSISQSAAPNTNIITLPEALDTIGTPLVWRTGGSGLWFGQSAVTHDGVDAAQSGPISELGSGGLATTLTGPGTLTFWWKVSSETNHDALHFFLNGSEQANISGEVDWQQRTISIPAGTQNLEWNYWNDSAGKTGQDCGWVDQVEFVPTSGCSVTLSPGAATHPSFSSTGLVSVAAAPTCSWSVLNTNFWISIQSGSNGTGNGTVKYVVAANPTTFSRSGHIRITDKLFQVTQTGSSNTNPPPTCTFVLSPTSANHNSGTSTNVVSVTTSSNCAWLVNSTNTWLTILSPATNVGSGTVIYAVAANPTASIRSGIVGIDGQNFFVTQSGEAPPCTVSISPSNRTHSSAAATGTVNVATAPGCTWSVMNTNPWITIVSTNNGATNSVLGTGPGTVVYSISANDSPAMRSGNIKIGGRNFLVVQLGVSSPCTLALSPASGTHGAGSSTGLVSVTTQASCLWSAVTTNPWITILSGSNTLGSISSVGNGMVRYLVAPNPSYESRIGAIRIGTENFLVRQDGASNGCFYSIFPGSRSHVSGGGTGTVSVTTQTGCEWNVNETNSWISILSGLNNLNSGTVIYQLAPNTNALTRSGIIRIDGHNFFVTQSGTFVSPTNVLPRIQFVGLTTNCTTLSLQGESGRMYVVECSEDFINWRPISTNCAPDIFLDPSAGTAPQRYYRTVEIR
jgi:hypothetical protein